MKRGVVVLTPFPFTGLTGSKVRPAVVVSRSDRPGNDVVLAYVTSIRSAVLPTDLEIAATHPDFPASGLKTSSVVKLDKLVTLDSSLVLGELGVLSDFLLRELNDRLRHALDL